MLAGRKGVLLLIFVLLFGFVNGQTTGDYRSVASNSSWSALSTWERWNGTAWTTPTVGEGYPGQISSPALVTIQNTAASLSLDVSPPNSIGALDIPAGNATTTLTFNGTNSLTVTGAISIHSPTSNVKTKQVSVNGGSLTCGSVAMTAPGGGSNRTSFLNVSTGTISVTGNVTMNSVASNAVRLTGAGTLNLGGSIAGGTLTTSAGSTVNYTGNNQTVFPVTYYNLTLSGSGTVVMTSIATINENFTLSGSVSATAAVDMTIGGSVTLGSGVNFNAGGLVHFIGGNWTNNGATVVTAGSTISFDNAAQTIGGSSSTTFDNLILTGSGIKTFAVATFIADDLSIDFPVQVNLSSITTHTSNTITLSGVGGAAGTWGSTTSSATNKSNTYFTATTGIITVAKGVFYSRTSGNWNDPTTWSFSSGGPAASTFPTAADSVVIEGGFTITVTADATCEALSFADVGADNTLSLISGITLTVSGTIYLAKPSNPNANTLAVGAGILNAASLQFTNSSGGSSRQQLTISTGTVNIPGDITMDNASSGTSIIFTGAGTLNVGVGLLTTGINSGTITTVAGSTINYSGANQTIKGVNYLGNVTLSGSGPKTLQTGTTSIGGTLTVCCGASVSTVGTLTLGNLSIGTTGNGSSFTAAGFALTVSGATTVGGAATTGALTISSATGTKTFTGLVTVASGGTWTNTAANSPATFRGGITNSGIFNAGTGIHTFDTNNQQLTGTFSIPNVTVTGITLTNNNTLTVSTALSGTGTLSQASNATLNIGAASAITNLNASNSGNTVNYNGTANQTIKTPVGSQYVNLSLNGTTVSGIAAPAAAATLNVSSTFTNNGTGTTGAFTGFNPNGGTINFNGTTTSLAGATTTSFNNLTISSGTLTDNSTPKLFNIGGVFQNNATFTANGGTVNFNGTTTSIAGTSTTSFNNLTISAGTLTDNSTPKQFNVGGSFQNNAAFVANGGTVNFNGTNTSIAGTSTSSFNNITISAGTLTDNSTPKVVNIGGSFQNNAAFTANGGTVNFNGATTSIAGTSTSSFNNITISAGTLTDNSTPKVVNIGGSFQNNAAFTANGGTVNFNGATTSIAGTSTTTFNNLTISAGTLTDSSTPKVFNIGGSFQNNAAFTANGGTVNFNGTTTSIAGTSTTGFNNVTISAGTLTDSSTPKQINIGGSFQNNAAFAANGGTVNFNGTTTSVTGSNTTNFNHLTISSGTLTDNSIPKQINVGGNFTNNGIFTANGDVVNFNGTSTLSGSSTTTFNHLQLAASSSLTLPAAIVNVGGNIDFNATSTFTPSTGTVVMNSGVAQTISANGKEFYTLRVNKTALGLSFLSSLPIQHLLDIQSNTAITTNNNLVILSKGISTANDGAIGPIPTLASITGNVTTQRYMDSIGNTYRYLGVPVSSALPPALWGSAIYTYKYTGTSGAYVGHSTSTPLTVGKGYLIGKNMNAPITWSVSGPITTGPYTWTFPEAGWHLLANPFASAIKWINSPGVAWDLTNVSTTIAVTDNSVYGYPNFFRYWDTTGGSPSGWGAGPLTNGMVAMGQAFWVYVGTGGGSLTIREGAKENSLAGEFYRTASEEKDALTIRLDNGRSADVAYLKIKPGATASYEFEHDLMKLKNPELNVFSMNAEGKQEQLVFNAMNKITVDTKIPLGIEVEGPGTYTLSFMDYDSFTYGDLLYLIDTYEGTATPISEGSYTFTLNQSSLSITDRFYISIDNDVPERRLVDVIQVYPNPVADKLSIDLPATKTVDIELIDGQGRKVFGQSVIGSTQIDVTSLPRGMYIVKVSTATEIEIKKIVKR